MYTLRTATTNDIPALSALLSQLFAIESDFTPDDARQRAGLQNLIHRPERSRILCACDADGALVAMATIQILVSTAQGTPVGLIEDMVVDPAHRHRGIGRMLLDELEAWSRQRGLTRLQLLADASNAGALAFYDRCDWSPTNLVARRKLL